MTSSLIKGTIVDVPMALADGLNNVPRLYGEQTEQRQPISDWKSGGEAAGKVRKESTKRSSPSLKRVLSP